MIDHIIWVEIEKKNNNIMNIILMIWLEVSDERTIRDELVIREGSSPETKRGKNDMQYSHLICLLLLLLLLWIVRFIYLKIQRIMKMNYE